MEKIKKLFEAAAASTSDTAMLHNGGIGFRIPNYQRQYNWSETNINRLFYNCLSGFHRLGTSPNADAFTFLGTLILVEESAQEPDFGGTSVAVVDGQQRLTTLTLFACALFESIRDQADILSSLDLKADVIEWIEAEKESHLDDLCSSIIGRQNIKGSRTYPFPRIVREEEEDCRGRSNGTSEYQSPLAKFLYAFSDYYDSDENKFTPPKLDEDVAAKNLIDNFKCIRKLVENLNDKNWYEDTECEQVAIMPSTKDQWRIEATIFLPTPKRATASPARKIGS